MQFPTAEEQAFGDSWTSPPSGKLKQELQTDESDTQPPASRPGDGASATCTSEPSVPESVVGFVPPPPSFFGGVFESPPPSVPWAGGPGLVVLLLQASMAPVVPRSVRPTAAKRRIIEGFIRRPRSSHSGRRDTCCSLSCTRYTPSSPSVTPSSNHKNLREERTSIQ